MLIAHADTDPFLRKMLVMLRVWRKAPQHRQRGTRHTSLHPSRDPLDATSLQLSLDEATRHPAACRVISRRYSVCNDVFLQELLIKRIELLGLLR